MPSISRHCIGTVCPRVHIPPFALASSKKQVCGAEEIARPKPQERIEALAAAQAQAPRSASA